MNDETVNLKERLAKPTRVTRTPISASERKSNAPLIIALTLTVFWAVFCGAYAYVFPDLTKGIRDTPMDLAMLALAVFLPIVLIWFVALAADAMQSLKSEAAHLRSEMADLRTSSSNTLPAPMAQPTHMEIRPDSWIKDQLLQIAKLAKQTEIQVADIAMNSEYGRQKLIANRDAPALPKAKPTHVDDNQASLPLTGPTEVETAPITVQEFLKALNFPDSPEDREGFRVMRRAKEDRELSKLLTTCQSLLSMLSQDGIYMDDLYPDPTNAGLWRRFVTGERSGSTATLGGIRDRSALALARNRMRVDTNFRATVHSYLVQYLDTLSNFEPTAEDQELINLSQTRSGKAFMLLGRLVGTFDVS
jgi:hypothetical protein